MKKKQEKSTEVSDILKLSSVLKFIAFFRKKF